MGNCGCKNRHRARARGKIYKKNVGKYGYLQKGQADTEANKVVFRMEIRKTNLESHHYIIYKGNRYDISHILPHFKSNSYLDVELHLRTE